MGFSSSKMASTTSTGDGGPGEHYKGIPARQIVNAPILFGTFVVTQVYAFWAYSRWKQRTFRQRIEERAAQLALEPMMLAERDREYLKQLRRNRDCERDLMKDVEGWEVGTYFGQPLYKTLGDDEIQWRAQKRGFYIHSAPWHATSEMGYTQWLSDQGGTGVWWESYPKIM